jgi:hypothetical protein
MFRNVPIAILALATSTEQAQDFYLGRKVNARLFTAK